MNTADRSRLLHVLDAIDRTHRYCKTGRSSLDDDMTRDAVLRCLTVIGEALGTLSDETYRYLPSLPPHLPKGQRNVLVHEYWRIDLHVIWNTIERDLPRLQADIRAALDDPSAPVDSA
ncbi:MAG: HepT-like ribonuclease domain-containing protein [Actinomycetota bacterium]